jgi:large subunit ribosomal protein L30e
MPVEEIKKNLRSKRLVLGTERTIKQLKLGHVSKVFLSSNCQESVRKDVNYYGSLGGCAVESLDVPNEELGVICKKPFSISVAGILKQ